MCPRRGGEGEEPSGLVEIKKRTILVHVTDQSKTGSASRNHTGFHPTSGHDMYPGKEMWSKG